MEITCKARIFLLVDLQDEKTTKSSENDLLTNHFQSFFFPFSEFFVVVFFRVFFGGVLCVFFNISRTNSKTSKVNQQIYRY